MRELQNIIEETWDDRELLKETEVQDVVKKHNVAV